MRTLSLVFLALTTAACSEAVGAGDGVVENDEVPGVGWTAELETLAHQVSGTAVIVDDSTIEISDFTFDGGGVDAHIFLLPDGADFNEDIELTENLVGTVFDGETLTLEIPQGVSFEDWNLITLWCIPFKTSFGEGVFQPPAE